MNKALIHSLKMFTWNGRREGLVGNGRKSTADAIETVFSDLGINSSDVTAEDIKKLYEKLPKDDEGFILVGQNNKYFTGSLKAMLNLIKNENNLLQDKMYGNCQENIIINNQFSEWEAYKVNGKMSLFNACVHIKKGDGVAKHTDYTFLFGIDNNKQRFLRIRVVKAISNDFIWG